MIEKAFYNKPAPWGILLFKRLAWISVLCMSFQLPPLNVFASIYEEETKISADAQNRLQKELENVFGKNRVSVLVRTELMIDPAIREAIKKSYVSSDEGASEPGAGGDKSEFLWKGEKEVSGSYVLPGFPAKKKAATGGSGWKPDKDLLLAAGTSVKKITVKISLDRKLSNDADNIAGSIATGFLNLNLERGDVLDIERISLPSAWGEFLRNPAAIAQMIQKVVLILGAVIITFLFVYGVLSLAKAIRYSVERIVNAIASMREKNVDMDIKYKHLGKRSLSGMPGQGEQGLLDDQDELSPSMGMNSSQEAGAGADGSGKQLDFKGASAEKRGKLVFDIGLDQVGKLYYLLYKENPDNIALVLPHLDADVKKAFMALLPKPTAAEVLSSLASIRFLEPEVLQRLKEEMERRMKGAVGGIDQVIDLIQNTDGKTQKELLDILGQKNSDLSKQVRSKLLLFEDILLVSDSEIQLLLSAVKSDDLSFALANAPSDLVDKVKSGLSRKMQDILQQMMTFRAQPPEDKVIASQDRIVKALDKLIREGKVRNPLLKESNEQKLIEAGNR